MSRGREVIKTSKTHEFVAAGPLTVRLEMYKFDSTGGLQTLPSSMFDLG
jgi:hypothetical protein